MESAKKSRIVYIDCARALCMLWVTGIYHMIDYMGITRGTFMDAITYGALASFAFVGGGMAGKTRFEAQSINGALKGVGRYYAKRIVRIYPLLILASIGFVVTYDLSWRIALANFTGVTMLMGEAPITLWFVGMQILFYIITPWIQYIPKRTDRLIVCLMLYLFFCLLHVVVHADKRLMMYFPFWCAGLFMSDSGFFERKEPSLFNLLTGTVSFFGLAIVFHDSPTVVSSGTSTLGFAMMGMFIVFLLELCRCIRSFHGLTSILCKIGYASMAAYMFHRPVFKFLQNLIGPFPIWLTYLLILPLFLLCSYGIQYTYDLIAKQILKKHLF